MKISSRYPKSKAGMSLIGMMIAVAISALLLVVSIPDLREMIFTTKDSVAANQEADFNMWYAEWTSSGAEHNSTTTNQGEMAKYLLDIMSSAPSTAGTPKRSGEIWVDETLLKTRTRSNSGGIRRTLKTDYVLEGSYVRFNTYYAVTFDPQGSKNRGTFKVSVISNE